jgi:hypothetical protein
MTTGRPVARIGEWSIWLWAFGYFAAYAPYSAMAKAVTSGEGSLGGLQILPVSTMASLVGMIVFIGVSGWWRDAGRMQLGKLSIPWPGRWTFLSGLCTAGIIGTTTLAYTLDGTSIVFMMLLMRGGVLILAPVVDALSRRKVRWFSWLALALSLGALVVAVWGRADIRITLLAALDVVIYLFAYFVRLRFMSRIAKSSDPRDSRRYFVEEQLVATPTIVLSLALLALWGQGEGMLALRSGFTDVLSTSYFWPLVLIGVLSQLTGVFGAFILLDKRENSFCVPVNRASSIISGVVAGFALYLLGRGRWPDTQEMIGAAMVTCAILALAIPPMVAARRRAQAEAPAPKLAA